MTFSEIVLGASLLAVGATFVACVVVTVGTFARAARQTRREDAGSGRLIYGSFGERPPETLGRQASRSDFSTFLRPRR